MAYDLYIMAFPYMGMGELDTVFALSIPQVVKFGFGVTNEVGYEAKRLGLKRVLLVTGRTLYESGKYEVVKQSLENEGIQVDVYYNVHIEPTDESIMDAVNYAKDKNYDGFVAFGGGSVMDTAKAVNLLTTYPAPIMDYINKPIGQGKAPPGPLKPLIAIPTTAGTGAENTGVIVLDVLKYHVKTGISHPYIRPTVALVDPLNTLSMPPMITASTGLDVLMHAIESYTARPYYSRPRPKNPAERPAYVGATPISDMFAEKAIEWVAKYLRRATYNGNDIEARYYMMLGASIAGIGFGHAGVHIPHAMSYAISGMVKEWKPPDYPVDYPLVPHGISVTMGAPAAFKYVAVVAPDRVAKAAQILGVHVDPTETPKKIGEAIYEALIRLMQDLGLPSGLKEMGFKETDIPNLVEGTYSAQTRLVLSPRIPSKRDLEQMFKDAMQYW